MDASGISLAQSKGLIVVARWCLVPPRRHARTWRKPDVPARPLEVGRSAALSEQGWPDRSPLVTARQAARQAARGEPSIAGGGGATAGPLDAFCSLPAARTRQCVRVK
jgi:hypothetical protein